MHVAPESAGEPPDADALIGREIVCVGLSEWTPELPTNQHHLMARLAQTNRVLFVESLGLRRPQVVVRDVRRITRRLRDGVRGVRQDGDVNVLSPLAIPAHGHPALRVVNGMLLRRQVGDAARRLGFQNPVLWAYVPQAETLIETLEPELVVYHCVDDLAAQKGVHAESFREAETRLTEKADLVLTSAPSLAERLGRISQNVIPAPNVADVEFFATALEKGPIDPGLAALPPPRVVFTGAIVATKIDMEWLIALARQRPHWSFALIGPVGFGDPATDVSSLRAVPNIHFLGARPYRGLPDVLRGADAALIPYALNALTASVFPMKVYEYIAAGLPVVATPLPAIEGVKEISICRTAEEAADELQRLMQENSPSRRQRRSAAAAGHSWTDRLAEIATAIKARSVPIEPRWSEGDLVQDLAEL